MKLMFNCELSQEEKEIIKYIFIKRVKNAKNHITPREVLLLNLSWRDDLYIQNIDDVQFVVQKL